VATRATTRGDFWEFLHAALGLQQSAATLADDGHSTEATLYERQALSLLLEATRLLEPGEPALPFVRMVAAAGLARLHGLTRSTERQAAQPDPTRRQSAAALKSGR
jgi:hypothetical protein